MSLFPLMLLTYLMGWFYLPYLDHLIINKQNFRLLLGGVQCVHLMLCNECPGDIVIHFLCITHLQH